MVIKNYTGDVMNFEMAREMAEMEGIKVDQVVVNDDVAVDNSLYTVGRRGVAGTVLLYTRSPEPWLKQARILRMSSRSLKMLSQMYAPWEWRSVPVRFRSRRSPVLNWAMMRWRSASASTANQGHT